MPNAPPAQQVRTAADALRELPAVESVAVRPVGEHAHGDRRAVLVVLPAGVPRVPPAVLKTLFDHDLGIADVTPQGDHLILAAV